METGQGTPTIDELWALVRGQQAEIGALKAELEGYRETGSGLQLSGTDSKFPLVHRRLSRAGLLKGVGAAAGLAAAGSSLSLARPALAAGTQPQQQAVLGSAPVHPDLASTPGRRYLSLGLTDFIPRASSISWETDALGRIGTPNSGISGFSAQPHLPDGTVVREIIVSVIHNDTNGMDIWFGFVPVSGAYTLIAQTTVTTVSSSRQDISLTVPPGTVVDNTFGVYFLEWFAKASDATQQLCGARIGYDLPGDRVIPITPTRVLDTRNGTGGYSGPQNNATLTLTLSNGAIGANGHLTMVPVPDSASGLIGNIRAYTPTAPGYMTVYPGNGAAPTASNLNYINADAAEQPYAICNQVTVGLQNQMISIFVSASTHVVFDLVGYIT